MRSALFIGLVASLVLLTACSAERRDWRSAEAADTVEAYDHFIEKHPDSERVTQARTRLEQLGEDRDWERASAANTVAALRQFLAQHPNGKWAGEARIRVENFALAESSPVTPTPPPDDPAVPSLASDAAAAASTPAPHVAVPTRPASAPAAATAAPPAGNFGIQLGAFGTEAAALAEWQRLQGRHGAQLASLKPKVKRGAAASGGTVFRLQANVGAETRARATCAVLAQASQPCVVVLPPR